ncbi:MAG: LacI family DNA-binding transcriptional regulator [Roseibium sp.]|nr:LacI family DNA-binding transcriptional regulator [Roseibium sp.]
MARRSTLADVAREAGLSVSTVDRVLNGREKVREDTASRVYSAATKVGYHAAGLIKDRALVSAPEMRFGFLLLKRNQEFYQRFEQALRTAVLECTKVRGIVDICFADSQDPGEHAELLTRLGSRAHAVAATAVNHHQVTTAVQDLRQRGIPVFSLLNDFAQGVRQGYIGLNNLKIGRIAAWTLLNCGSDARKVAIFVGGSRWHGHELRETGFRSFFREHAPETQILETLVNLETRQVTYEATVDLLKRHNDLSGIFIAGGGMEGAIQALRELRAPGQVCTVFNERTDVSTLALQQGYATLINATPLEALCTELLDWMMQSLEDAQAARTGQHFLQPDLYVPESL